MQNSSNVRDTAVDIARLVCALLVAVLHTEPFEGINPYLNTIAAVYIPRLAVPFFLCISGYYFMNGLISGKNQSKMRISQYMKTYIAWSLAYCFVSFFCLVLTGRKSLGTFLGERVLYFFTVGSYSHLWYMPALIFSVLVTIVVYTTFGKKGLLVMACSGVVLHVIGSCGSAYFWLSSELPMLSVLINSPGFERIARVLCLGISLFSSGYFVLNIIKTSTFLLNILLLVASLFFVTEVIFLTFFAPVNSRTEIFFSQYPLVILLITKLLSISKAKPDMKALSYRVRAFGGFLFFLHPFIVDTFKMASTAAKIYIQPMLLLFLTLAICIAAWLICCRISKKLASILSGISVDKSTNLTN